MKRSRIWLSAALAAIFVLVRPQAGLAATAEASICDIVHDPLPYEGREVTIRGRLLAGPFSDFMVAGRECSAGFEVQFTRDALNSERWAEAASGDIDGLLAFLESPVSTDYDVEVTLTGQIAVARDRPEKYVTIYVERIRSLQTNRHASLPGEIEPK
jgi:hypothetical protein